MTLEIFDVCKEFDTFRALDNINLAVNDQEFVCLLGPSGCGKTTLLRIIAGLLDMGSGRVTFEGHDLSAVPARERGFGIVFQSYSLFPNMTVAQNIAYGLKIRSEAKPQIEKRVAELLATIKMPELAQRYPWQLSGGQQQRVALARALAVDPRLILLDEPLSALDARVRSEMRAELHELQRRLQIPTIMVTHDQEEALMLADKIVCMNNGVIEQVGSPHDLYLRPKTRFVADFVGLSNLLPTAWVRGNMPTLMESRPVGPDADFELCVRPENLRLESSDGAPAKVVGLTFLGSLSRINVNWNGQALTAECHSQIHIHPGTSVHLHVAPESCHWVQA